MWKEVEHVILAPEKVIDEIVDVFGLLLNLRPYLPFPYFTFSFLTLKQTKGQLIGRLFESKKNVK